MGGSWLGTRVFVTFGIVILVSVDERVPILLVWADDRDSDDFFAVAGQDLEKLRRVLTVFGGRVVRSGGIQLTRASPVPAPGPLHCHEILQVYSPCPGDHATNWAFAPEHG